jgi:hypothetical protein
MPSTVETFHIWRCPMTQEHYYENGGAQCPVKSIVVRGEDYGRVHICELTAGHAGEHERVNTWRLARVEEWSKYRWFKQ